MLNKKYELIGIRKDGKIICYKGETVEQFVENELLGLDGEKAPDTMDKLVKDMDLFSEYKHYYRPLN